MLRSVFISGFSLYLTVALAYALLQLFRGMDPLISWLGLTLAAGAPAAFYHPDIRQELPNKRTWMS
jgi:hypothetical protein